MIFFFSCLMVVGEDLHIYIFNFTSFLRKRRFLSHMDGHI